MAVVYLALAAALAALERVIPHEPRWNRSDGGVAHGVVFTLLGSGATGAVAEIALVADSESRASLRTSVTGPGSWYAPDRARTEETPMTPHDTIRLFSKTLDNLEKWMDKAAEHAKARSFDVEILVQARLAPNAFALSQQVQAACDQAKYAAAYLSGKPAPSHPDTEKTFAELRERIQKCTTFLTTVEEKDLAGADERKVAPPWLQGRWLSGHDYLVEVAVPNFFFHVTMAYAILRHNGVELGKMDYIGSLPTQEG